MKTACTRFFRRFFTSTVGLALCLTAPMTTAQEACKLLIASGNPQYPPYLWQDPADETRLIGANADLLQLLSKELNLPISMRYVGPWARVQEETRAGRVDLIAGAFWTAARTDYMDYFYPPFHDTRSVVWVRQGSKLNYTRWRDLAGLQGVTVINNSFGEAFDSYARTSLKISQVASLEQAIKMLQLARADYLVYEDRPGQAYLARSGSGSGSGVKMLDTAVANESLHLTLSYKSACNSGEMRGRISQALHKLATPKLMAELLTRNIELWRTQSLPP